MNHLRCPGFVFLKTAQHLVDLLIHLPFRLVVQVLLSQRRRSLLSLISFRLEDTRAFFSFAFLPLPSILRPGSIFHLQYTKTELMTYWD